MEGFEDQMLGRLIERLLQEESVTIYDQVMNAVEPIIIRSVMNHCGGHQFAAAELLGVSRMTLRRKLRKYEISVSRNMISMEAPSD